MLKVERTMDVAAPVELVWEKISAITEIQDWSRTVNEAHFHTEKQRGIGAGRTCDVRGFGTLIEDVVEWTENEGFTLSLRGLPKFVKEASGGWRLVKTGPNTTRVTTHVHLQTRYGLVGSLMEKFLLKANFAKTLAVVQGEFKSYVEGSTAEVRKAG